MKGEFNSMKKSIIPALLLSVVTLGGLVSCNGDKPATTPVTPTEKTIAEIIADTFVGKPGEYVDGKYTLDLKEGANTNVTVTGTYISGGEWTYYENDRSGYIRDDAGDILFVHTADKTQTNLKADLKVGAKVKITGTLTAYNGYPQIGSGWTYELLEAAPTSGDYSTIQSYYKDVTVADLVTDANGTLNLDKAKTLVHLSNMVSVGSFSADGLTYFTPLEEIGKENATKLGIYRFHNEAPGVYTPGNVFDLYGAVTSYKGTVQLHVTSHSSEDKFTGVQQVDASGLTAEQKLAIADLQGSMAELNKEVTFDYISGTPTESKLTLRRKVISGMSIYHKAEVGGGAATTDWFTIEDDGLAKTLTIKPLAAAPTENQSGTIILTRRVCASTDCATEADAWALSDKTKYKEEKITISVKHIVKEETSMAILFTGNKVPSGIKYITNDAKYPNPSWGSGDFADSMKLAYVNGGVGTDGKYNFGTSVNVELDLAVAHYKDGNRAHEVTITALDNTGSVVKSVDVNTYDAENVGKFRKVTTTITLDEGVTNNIVDIEVKVKTATGTTLYIKGVTITKATA